MIKFFRKIRQRLLTENKFSKYLLYAIGEIALVVIGILIALGINNWNIEQNERTIENKLYDNLLTSLSSDSKDLQIINEAVNQSLEAQQIIISKSLEDIVAEYSESNIHKIVLDVMSARRSFFPKYGAYYQITNEGLTQLISSEEIKSQLIEVYDLNYKRYEHIDKTIEQKVGFGLNDLIYGKMNIRQDKFDVDLFKKNYQELQFQCRVIGPLTQTINNALVKNIETVSQLILLLENQLEIK